jgi:hypothetical protein
LIESPLAAENHTLVKEFSRIYFGVLNYYDIIISKLFRGTQVDNEDCLVLVKNKSQEIDLRRLEERLRKTASYDVSEGRVIQNWEYFVELLSKEGLHRGKQ